MSDKQIRARNWIITINNFTPEHVEFLKAVPCLKIVAGYENCEKDADGSWKSLPGKTRHIQAAIAFKKPIRWNAMQKMQNWGYFAVMKGTWSDQSYCVKDGMVLRVEDNSKGFVVAHSRGYYHVRALL